LSARFEFRPLQEADPAALLARADGAAVPGGNLEIWLGPKRVGGRYFRAAIASDRNAQPFLHGLYNTGPYPAQNWIEIFDMRVPGEPLADYLRPLADTIPPGGHLSIEYENPVWQSTFRDLLAGTPPADTPLGKLLASLGCGASYKDWYFPEGGQEGGRKLQGNKALTAAAKVNGPRHIHS